MKLWCVTLLQLQLYVSLLTCCYVFAGVQLRTAAPDSCWAPGAFSTFQSYFASNNQLRAPPEWKIFCGFAWSKLGVHWGCQLPHSILALAVQKDLTFAAVRSDIYVCRRVHWCAALA